MDEEYYALINYHSSPELSNFTEEEERLILKLHVLFGNRWSEIATHFPERTPDDIRNYWNTRARRTLLKQVDLLEGPKEYNPTTESLSNFVDYITKLSCEEPKSIRSEGLWVFWSEEECLHSPFKEQILSVLRQITFINYFDLDLDEDEDEGEDEDEDEDEDEEKPNMLVQYWAPTIIEGQRFLTTSQQPFAVANVTSSFGSYRMHSISSEVYVDGGREEELGPIGRVFRSGVIEASPDVEYYSINEYPHQALALRCGIRSSLALPILESSSRSCVGVLEFVYTFYDMRSFLQISDDNEVFEDSGLVVPVVLHSEKILNREQSELIFQNINYKKVLEELCQIHELPLAGTWFPFRHDSALLYGGDMEKNCNNLDMICTREVVMPGDFEQYDLYCAYRYFLLRRGQGLVGRALLSRKPYFCRDLTQLSITKYPLSHFVRKFKLNGCFAICLQSTFTPHDFCVVELFLPPCNTNNATPQTFLGPLLAKMKQLFPTLKVSSGEEQRDILSVEVIEVTTTDERNHTIICETTTSSHILEALQNEGEAVHLDSPDQQLIVEDTIQNGRDVIGAEESNTTITTSPPRLEALQDEGEAVHLDSSDQQLIMEDTIQNIRDVIGAEKNNTTVMLEKKHRTTQISITLEDVEPLFGMKLKDAAKNLGVSRSSFKRELRVLGIKRWPTPRSKNNHSTCNLKNAKGSVQGNEEQVSQSARPPKKSKTVAHTVTIKATCGEDIIKFTLSVQSGIAELREEVTKRLKLELRTFRLKYEDDAGDLVLMTCDEDLQFCISSFSSSDCPIKMLVLAS